MPASSRRARPLKFLHTGDLHLDSAFVGLSTEAPAAVTELLREATIRSWREIVRIALEEPVDFAVVAGDVFEQANRTLRGQIAFRDGLEAMARAGIPSFVVTGNHDPLSGWEPSVRWPELAHRFDARQVTSMPVVREGEEIARVYGISYLVRDVTTNLAAGFHRDPDSPFAVGLLHANVGGIEGFANYAPCTFRDLRAADMDYWALGHIHRHQVLLADRPTAVYCGNPQGRDPGETEPRGCYVVSVDAAGVAHPEFRVADTVRWQLVDVPVDGLTTEEDLVEAVVRAADDARVAAGRSLVVRLTLRGRGPLHRSLRRAGLLDQTRDVARERLGDSVPFAWIESLRDKTAPEIDLASRRLADDFLGGLLRRFDATQAALASNEPPAPGAARVAGAVDPPALQPDQLSGVLDGLYAHTRGRQFLREARPDRATLGRLVTEAESILVDRLAGEG